jgi:Lipocalin-like domain
LKIKIIVVGAMLLLPVGVIPESAAAQQAKDVVGSWAHVSNVNTAADGKKSDLFGANPKGQAIFTSDGRYSLMLQRAELPAIAANSRTQGTSDENRAIVSGMISLYGSYTIIDKVLIMKVEGSSYPNWVGTEQKRPIVLIGTDEIQLINASGSSGGRNEVGFKRIK